MSCLRILYTFLVHTGFFLALLGDMDGTGALLLHLGWISW